MFAKFLEDGAREVCLAQAAAELALADPNARVLSRTVPTLAGTAGNLTTLTDAQVTESLVYLSTRFWGAPLSGRRADEVEELLHPGRRPRGDHQEARPGLRGPVHRDDDGLALPHLLTDRGDLP